MAGELHHRHLHTQADAEDRAPGARGPSGWRRSCPRCPGRRSRRAPGRRRTPPSSSAALSSVTLLGVHPADVHLHVVLDATVGQRLHHGEIGVVAGRHISPPGRSPPCPRGRLARSTMAAHSARSGFGTGSPVPRHDHIGQTLLAPASAAPHRGWGRCRLGMTRSGGMLQNREILLRISSVTG